MTKKKYNLKKALTSGCNCVGRKHDDERLGGVEKREAIFFFTR